MITGTPNVIKAKLPYLDQSKKYELKEYKEKRSNDANAYYHVLKDKIADVLRENKEELHFKFLKRYGQGYTAPFPATKDIKGFVKYYEFDRDGVLNGIEVKYYRLYKGSSEMNKAEMAILIEGVVQEAKNLDIETKTPEELAKLKWLGEQLYDR